MCQYKQSKNIIILYFYFIKKTIVIKSIYLSFIYHQSYLLLLF
jgi:hypothetical protein